MLWVLVLSSRSIQSLCRRFSNCRPSTTDDLLFDHLSPPDLLRYSRASKTAHWIVSSYMRRNFNLQKSIGRFFTKNQISQFRYLQSKSGMLISGSTALQFFERVLYPEFDLDIYVDNRYFKWIAIWLTNIGYTYESRPGQDLAQALRMTTHVFSRAIKFLPPSTSEYSNFGVASVYNFHKSDDLDCKIQLITSHHSPLELILKFHSSACSYSIKKMMLP